MGLWSFLIRNKWKVLVALLIIIILLTVFGARLWLYAKFLFGSDILIQVAPSDTYILIASGQQNATFKTSITANPFCEADCISVFEDISSNVTLYKNYFRLKGQGSLEEKYPVGVKRLGTGQDLYRFTVNCKGIRTALCDTSNGTKERSVLLAVEYRLNETTLELKRQCNEQFNEIRQELAQIEQRAYSANATLSILRRQLSMADIEGILENALEQLPEYEKKLYGLNETWQTSDYELLARQLDFVQSEISETGREISHMHNIINGSLIEYTQLAENASNAWGKLMALNNPEYAYSSGDLYQSAAFMRNAMREFAHTKNLNAKRIIIGQIEAEAENATSVALLIHRNQTIERELNNDIFSDILCNLTATCQSHASLAARVNETNLSLQAACAQTTAIKRLYPNASAGSQQIARLIIQKEALKYLAELPNGPNSELIRKILSEKSLNITEQAYNASQELVRRLASMLPEECPGFAPFNRTAELPPIISWADVNVQELPINLEEPAPKCCIAGKCANCCMSNCGNENYPILFLHGHALDKALSAEFNLDTFDQMQDRLQADGFINAGAISSYIGTELPQGIWAREPEPISLKASYYINTFKNEQGFTSIQAKSESIDTYAVRLKEIIDDAKVKSGRQKVVIIAHSMGGLVARRYIQLFGSGNIDKLILIAVPNNGIGETIQQYCRVFGGSLECQDMAEGSIFISKLKSWQFPDINVTNIIGKGCQTGKNDGDGIVTVDEAWLDGANNIIVNGTCKQFDLLHGQILDYNIHPEVYRYVLEALQ
jgi:pimeloyl-ACP methyl ester carboxylesterase